MKPRTLIPLVLGLAVGFFAIKMGIDMVQKAKGAPADERRVVVSAKTIDSAVRIVDTMLTTKMVPTALAPADGFADPAKMKGRVSGMMIPAGIPITAAMLAPVGSEPGLRAVIPRGFRAVSISVNEESAVAGFIAPGCRVDVLVAEGGKLGLTKQILANVEVGAVGQSMSEVAKDGKTVRMAKSVTLFLRPEEVEILHAHTGKGKLRLALRGDNKDPGDSLWAKMLEGMKRPDAPAVQVAAVAPPRHVVEVVRGTLVEHISFDARSGARIREDFGASQGADGVQNPAETETEHE